MPYETCHIEIEWFKAKDSQPAGWYATYWVWHWLDNEEPEDASTEYGKTIYLTDSNPDYSIHSWLGHTGKQKNPYPAPANVYVTVAGKEIDED